MNFVKPIVLAAFLAGLVSTTGTAFADTTGTVEAPEVTSAEVTEDVAEVTEPEDVAEVAKPKKKKRQKKCRVGISRIKRPC